MAQDRRPIEVDSEIKLITRRRYIQPVTDIQCTLASPLAKACTSLQGYEEACTTTTRGYDVGDTVNLEWCVQARGLDFDVCFY